MGSRSRIYISLLSVLAIGMVDMASMSAGAEMVPDENGVMMYDYGGSVDTVYNPKGWGSKESRITTITKRPATRSQGRIS